MSVSVIVLALEIVALLVIPMAQLTQKDTVEIACGTKMFHPDSRPRKLSKPLLKQSACDGGTVELGRMKRTWPKSR